MHAWTDVSPVGFSKITSWSWCDWVIRSPWMIASLSVDLHCTTNFWISSMYNNYKWMNYWIEHECPIFCLLAISTTCTHKWRSKWRGRNVKNNKQTNKQQTHRHTAYLSINTNTYSRGKWSMMRSSRTIYMI